MLSGIDLKDVTALTYRYASLDKSSSIKVRIDSLKGPVISTFDFAPTGNWNFFKETTTDINDPGGKHDLYFVFVKPDTPNKHLAALDWVRFDGGKEVIEKPKAVVRGTKSPKVAPNALEKGETAAGAKSKTKASKRVASAGSVLIAKSDCKTCHAPNAKLVGPSFVQIATRYKNKSGAVSMLAGKVIKGGAGNWGQVPMTPHPAISKKEATQIVQYILSLRK